MINRTHLYTLLCALAAIALLMLGLGVKMIFKKHGEFKRHCSSMDPYTGERGGCVCGHAAQSLCEKNVFDKPSADRLACMPRRENEGCEETNVFDKPSADRLACMPRRENDGCEETKEHYSPLEVNGNLMDEVEGGQRQ